MVLVAKVGTTSRDALQRMRQVIDTARGNILGAVATGSGKSGLYGYGGDYYEEEDADLTSAGRSSTDPRRPPGPARQAPRTGTDGATVSAADRPSASGRGRPPNPPRSRIGRATPDPRGGSAVRARDYAKLARLRGRFVLGRRPGNRGFFRPETLARAPSVEAFHSCLQDRNQHHAGNEERGCPCRRGIRVQVEKRIATPERRPARRPGPAPRAGRTRAVRRGGGSVDRARRSAPGPAGAAARR